MNCTEEHVLFRPVVVVNRALDMIVMGANRDGEGLHEKPAESHILLINYT